MTAKIDEMSNKINKVVIQLGLDYACLEIIRAQTDVFMSVFFFENADRGGCQ